MNKILLLIVCIPLFASAQEDYPFLILKKHTAPVLNVAFSPDGQYLASCGEDKFVHLWKTGTWAYYKSFPEHLFSIKSILYLYNKEGKFLLTNGDYTIKKWTQEADPIKIYSGPATTLWTMDASPDGRYLIGGSYEVFPKIYDMGTKPDKPLALKGHEKNALVGRFHPNGKQVLTGSLDQTLKLWDAKTGACIRTFKGHGGNIYDAKFLPDTNYFVSASEDRTIRLWKTTEEKSVKTFVGHREPIMSLIISKNGKFLLSGSQDNTVKLWEISTGVCLFTFDHTAIVHGISVSSDEKILAAAYNDNTIGLWNLNIEECVVRHYFEKEFQAKLDSSALFRPKEKSEKKELYEQRIKESQKLKELEVKKYFEQYKTSIDTIKLK